jgi:hypothetical protein
LDTIFEGNDDDDNDDEIYEPVEREVSKEYYPLEVIHEELYQGIENDGDDVPGDIPEHALMFQVKNIRDFGICRIECSVWAETTDGSVINAKDKVIYIESNGVLYPDEIWDNRSGALAGFDYYNYKFPVLKDATIYYSFDWEKCKADVKYISVLEMDIDGKPTARVTVKNTGGTPVHSVTAEVSAWHTVVSESLAFDLVVFKNGGTLMPGDTAEAVAVFEENAAGFGGIDHFIRVDIRFEEGPGPDVGNQAQ